MSRTDEELIRDALDHIEALKRHLTRGDLDDETVADAVSLRLAAAIEAVAEASPDRGGTRHQCVQSEVGAPGGSRTPNRFLRTELLFH